VTLVGDEFRASGVYERSGNAFGLGFGLAGIKPTRHKVEYVGKIVGRRIDGLMQRTSEEAPPPNLLSIGFQDNKTKFSMIIVDDSASRIMVIENPASVSPQFYDLEAG
jgi:hypothetical protein